MLCLDTSRKNNATTKPVLHTFAFRATVVVFIYLGGASDRILLILEIGMLFNGASTEL